VKDLAIRIKKVIPLAMLCILALCLVVSVGNVKALSLATSASVQCKGNSAGTGPDITACSEGQQIWVFWTQSPPSTVVEVKVLSPGGTTVIDQTNLQASASGTPTFTVTQAGTYYVLILGANNIVLQTKTIASATIFAMPESVFGALAAVGAGFAAFAVVKIRGKHTDKTGLTQYIKSYN
jgi:plastocyanin